MQRACHQIDKQQTSSSTMKSRHAEHKCTLGKLDDVLPIHPAEKWYDTLLKKMKLSLVMYEDHKWAMQYFRTKARVRKEQKLHARGRFWFVVHPFSKFRFLMQFVYSVVFLERWLLVLEYKSYALAKTWEVIRECVWFMLILSSAFTGYTKSNTLEVVMHPKSTCLRYFCTYFFVDLLFFLEFLVDDFLFLLSTKGLDPSRYLLVVEAILTLYIFCFLIRLKSIFDFTENLASFTKINEFYIFLFDRIFLFVCMLHFFAILFYHIPWSYYYRWYNGVIPETSWLAMRQTERTFAINGYIESLLIVISYFLNIHHYDNITEVCEQILLIIFSLVGKVYVIVFIAQVLVKFVVNKSESTYENLHIQLVNYMETMKVPDKIKKQILDRFIFVYQKKYFNESELMATVSEQLKLELFMFSAKRLLKNNEFLKKLSSAQKGFLMAHMRSETYTKGEVIREFGYKQRLYFISSGSVSALGENKLVLYELHDSDEFGLLPTYGDCENDVIQFLVLETSEIYSVNMKVILELLEEDSHLMNYFQQLVQVRKQLVNDSLREWRIHGESLLDNIKMGNILEQRLTKELVLD